MEYAIDRYSIGTELEVSAGDFNNSYIPRRTSRFFCPECGEQVYWRAAGGSRTSHFYHKEKTVLSPECDKRVDGKAGLNLYERVGLPLFLSNIGGSFQLSIGFPALGAKLLHQATQRDIKVIINGDSHERSAPLNSTIFYDSSITMVPINFIPSNSSNYSISLNSSYGADEIMRRWSDYADGFGLGGAIFLHGEITSKKIRRGDSVSPGKEYYIVSNNFSPNHPEIKYSRIGSIQLNNSDYSIYSVTIEVTSKDTNRFTKINDYFKRLFNVWLLETSPEITPLWPPCIQQDVLVSITKGKIHCAVISGNAVPHVYSYTGSYVSTIPVTNQNERSTIEISSYSSLITLSVDRKYVGREITISRRSFSLPDYQYQFAFKRKDLSAIDVTNLVKADLSTDFLITSNSKLEVYIGSEKNTFQHISVRSSTTSIAPRKDSCRIILLIEGSLYEQYQVIVPKNQFTYDENYFISDLLNHARGTMVQAPRWVICFSERCRKTGYIEVSAAILRLIINGKIAIGALQFLLLHKDFYLGSDKVE